MTKEQEKQNYYASRKQQIQARFQKAQNKYVEMAFMLGREFVAFQERGAELQEELKEIELKEKNEKPEAR